jgi:hypothetical protein
VADAKVIGCGRCPLKLKSLPSEPCPEGLKSIAQVRDGKEPSCPWFIADLSANACFWTWMNQNKGTETPDSKIAQLLCETDDDIKRTLSNFKRRTQKRGDLID